MLRKLPFLIAVAGMIGGVCIAILFGVNEDLFKDRIAAQLERNTAVQAIQDPDERQAKFKKEKDKNWRYFQRYHFHATGIGAMSVALLVLLTLVRGASLWKTIAAYAVSLGGFFYPFVWLFAALYGPEIGREAAKEKFAVFGYMGGLFLVGAMIVFALVAVHPLKLQDDSDD